MSLFLDKYTISSIQLHSDILYTVYFLIIVNLFLDCCLYCVIFIQIFYIIKQKQMQKDQANLESKRTRCLVYTRVMWFVRPVQFFNTGKKSEFYSRKYFEDKSLSTEINTNTNLLENIPSVCKTVNCQYSN